MSRAVVLLSGGQDSTTCLYWAKVCFDGVEAFCVDYGQRHSAEVVAASEIAQLADVPLAVVAMPAFSQYSGAPLVASGTTEGLSPEGTAAAFLPGRNAVLLSLAAGFAYERAVGNIVAGFCETDAVGYPDCRAAFTEAMQTALSLGLGCDVRIHAPLLHSSKMDTVALARRLPGCWDALALSVTCYEGKRPGCGSCPACRLRAKGFDDAGERDPGRADMSA